MVSPEKVVTAFCFVYTLSDISSLYNGFCRSFGDGTQAARALCPAIDAKITMTPNGAGSYRVTFDRDAHPSVQVNRRPVGGSSWSEIAHADESHSRFAPFNLINLNWSNWAQRRNEATANFRLPQGCDRM